MFPVFLMAASQTTEPNTPYLFPVFLPGTIYFTQSDPKEVILNYHMLKQQMVVAQSHVNIPITDISAIDSVLVGKQIFIKKSGQWREQLIPPPHQLVVGHHASLQLEAKEGAYGTKSHSIQVDQMFFGDEVAGNYDLLWSDEYKFVVRREYFFLRDGQMKKTNNMKQIIKLFPNHKKSIKDYAASRKVDFKQPDQVRLLFSFCLAL